MEASRAKARLTRKSRPSETGRGGKAARPVHPTKSVSGRMPRVVKARAGRPPIPANDTLPLPAEEMTASELPELEETPASAPAAEADEAGEGGEANEAALSAGDGSDDDEDDADEEVTVERKRGEDEPAS